MNSYDRHDPKVLAAIHDAGSIEVPALAQQLGLPHREVQWALYRLKAQHQIHSYDGPGPYGKEVVAANVFPGRAGLTVNQQRVLRAIYCNDGWASHATIYDFEDVRLEMWSYRAVRNVMRHLVHKGLAFVQWNFWHRCEHVFAVALADADARAAAELRFRPVVAAVKRKPKKATRHRKHTRGASARRRVA